MMGSGSNRLSNFSYCPVILLQYTVIFKINTINNFVIGIFKTIHKRFTHFSTLSIFVFVVISKHSPGLVEYHYCKH